MDRFKNVVLTTPTLAIKAGSSALAKHSAFQFLCNGLFYAKGAADCPALTGTIPDDYGVIYTFTVDSAGTTAIYRSDTFAKTAAFNFSNLFKEQFQDGTNALLWTNEVIIGWLVLINDSGSNFVGGTTALDTASVTTYYINNFGLSPQDMIQ